MVPKTDSNGFERTSTGRVIMTTVRAASDISLSMAIRKYVPAGDAFDFTDEMARAAAQEWAERYPTGKPLTDAPADRRGWIVETNTAVTKLLS